MATEAIAISLLPALVVGAVIGLVEMFFVHQDEIGMGWFGHGLHAIPFTIGFTFASINVTWVLAMVGYADNWMYSLGARALIAIIAMIKIQAAAAIAGRVGERFGHTFIIGCLIFAVGYFWDFLGPAVESMLPAYLTF